MIVFFDFDSEFFLTNQSYYINKLSSKELVLTLSTQYTEPGSSEKFEIKYTFKKD